MRKGEAMFEKVDFMVRFWLLQARMSELGAPLTGPERSELLSLMHLLSGDEPFPPAGPPPHNDDGAPAQLTTSSGFLAAEVRHVCADGIVAACATPMRKGQRTILRMADALSGVEFTIPCVVVWSHRGRPSAMGLRVDGVPRRLPFAMPIRGLWRSPAFAPTRPESPPGALPH
jgi:hypothetical protein